MPFKSSTLTGERQLISTLCIVIDDDGNDGNKGGAKTMVAMTGQQELQTRLQQAENETARLLLVRYFPHIHFTKPLTTMTRR
jgi:hypothetical protein